MCILKKKYVVSCASGVNLYIILDAWCTWVMCLGHDLLCLSEMFRRLSTEMFWRKSHDKSLTLAPCLCYIRSVSEKLPNKTSEFLGMLMVFFSFLQNSRSCCVLLHWFLVWKTAYKSRSSYYQQVAYESAHFVVVVVLALLISSIVPVFVHSLLVSSNIWGCKERKQEESSTNVFA